MILAAINFLLGSFDAYTTQRRIQKYGIESEFNRPIRFLATHLGPYLAAIIGVLGPLVGWTYIFTVLDTPTLLAIYVGANLHKFYIQLLSLQTEERLDAMLAAELSKRHGAASVNPPQSDVSTSPSSKAAPSSPFKYSERYDPRDKDA